MPEFKTGTSDNFMLNGNRMSISDIKVEPDESKTHTARTTLAGKTADQLFDLADKDHSGLLDMSEFRRLHKIWRTTLEADVRAEQEQVQKTTRTKQRLHLSICIGAVLLFFLALSCAANAISVFYIVDRSVTTQAENDGQTSPLITRTGQDVTTTQSGREASLGLLPFLPIISPSNALQIMPDFVAIHDPTLPAGTTTGYKIERVVFASPNVLTIDAANGDRIVLRGAAHGVLIKAHEMVNANFSDESASMGHEFCSACSTVSLKSIPSSSHGLQAAQTAFAHQMTTISASESALCQTDLQVGSLLGLQGNVRGQNLDMRDVDPLPAICSAPDSLGVGAATPARRELAARRLQSNSDRRNANPCRNQFRAYLRSGGNGNSYRTCKRNLAGGPNAGEGAVLFYMIDQNNDNCIDLAELLSVGAFEVWASDTCGADLTLEETDQLMSTWSCCSFHDYAEVDAPQDCMNEREFALFSASLINAGPYYAQAAAGKGSGGGPRTFVSGGLGLSYVDVAAAEALCEDSDAVTTVSYTSSGRKLSHSASCPDADTMASLYGTDGYCNVYDPTAATADPDCITGGCHPSSTLLTTAKGDAVRIDQLKVGTLIQTAEGVEPVTALMHAEPDKASPYFRFHTANASMAITDGHWLFVNGVERDPSTVKVGEMLRTLCCGEQPITKIDKTLEQGLFHITTPSNNYYADGVLSSTYVAFVPLNVWKVAGGLYPRLRYSMGLPITPEGQGPLTIFWPLYVYHALGLPQMLIDALWPLTMSATLVAELINTLVVQLPVSTAALTVGTLASLRVSRK